MASIKQRAALVSVAVTLALTTAKGAVGIASGSLAILAEAAHGLVDVAATLITFYAVRLADKPADDQHHYGHAKIESIAALAETAFLFLVSGVVVAEAVRRLIHGGQPVEVTPVMAVLMVVVIAVDIWRVRVMSRIARETGSQALESGALHFSADIASSAVVLIGLGFVWLGHPQADAIAAIIVAILICTMSWRLGRRTIDALMDAAPKGASETITGAVADVPGVVGIDHVRLRPAGATVFAEVGVRVGRALTLDQVSAIRAKAAEAAGRALAGTQASVTALPMALDDETVMERVHLIARGAGLAVHHVTVQHIGERLAIGLDLEVDGALALGEAHEVASKLEAAIRTEIGADTEVETHIEPMAVEALAGDEAAPEEVAALARRLADIAVGGPISDVHSVRVRATGAGLVVIYHCRADPTLSVAMVHAAVDAMERRLRSERPDVVRMVGHTEPVR